MSRDSLFIFHFKFEINSMQNRSFFFIVQRILLWCGTVLLFWSIGLWFHRVILTPETEWIKWLYEGKRSRLIEKKDQPRVILLGGSGIFFGVDSPLLEKQLGLPVINGGTHAGIGLNATLNLFLPNIQKGDQIILITEYGMLNDSDGIGDLAAPTGGAVFRPTLGARSPIQAIEQAFAVGRPSLRTIAYQLNRWIDGSIKESGYIRSMNPYGDADQIPESKLKSAPSWGIDRMTPSPHSLAQLRRFRQEVEARGAQLTIGLPWVLVQPDPETQAQLQHTFQVLNEIAPVMMNPTTLNAQSDVTLFSDTVYHLSVKGRKLRSQELADLLKRRFQQNP
jgi:hypothetical protein